MANGMSVGAGLHNQAAAMQQLMMAQQRAQTAAVVQASPFAGGDLTMAMPQDRGPLDSNPNQGLEHNQAARVREEIIAARRGQITTLPDGTTIRMSPQPQNQLTLPDGTTIRGSGFAPQESNAVAGEGEHNMAAKMQAYLREQQQAQTTYEQISARSRMFSALYDGYSTGQVPQGTSGFFPF